MKITKAGKGSRGDDVGLLQVTLGTSDGVHPARVCNLPSMNHHTPYHHVWITLTSQDMYPQSFPNASTEVPNMSPASLSDDIDGTTKAYLANHHLPAIVY